MFDPKFKQHRHAPLGLQVHHICSNEFWHCGCETHAHLLESVSHCKGSKNFLGNIIKFTDQCNDRVYFYMSDVLDYSISLPSLPGWKSTGLTE